MPCRSYVDDFPAHSISAQKREDALAKMLCACCKHIENVGHTLPSSVIDWWVAHQESDRLAEIDLQKRLLLEEQKRRAINKLTFSERRLLGL